MKKAMLMFLMLNVFFLVKAQDAEGYTDEDLTKYAKVMVWADEETDKLRNIVIDSVEIWLENTELTNARYNDLSKAERNGSLESAEATASELATFKKIQARIDTKKEKFTELYKTKIKDEIGAGLYNNLRKDLKTDAAVKARYEEIEASLKTEKTTEDTTTSDGEAG